MHWLAVIVEIYLLKAFISSSIIKHCCVINMTNALRDGGLKRSAPKKEWREQYQQEFSRRLRLHSLSSLRGRNGTVNKEEWHSLEPPILVLFLNTFSLTSRLYHHLLTLQCFFPVILLKNSIYELCNYFLKNSLYSSDAFLLVSWLISVSLLAEMRCIFCTYFVNTLLRDCVWVAL